MAATRKTTTRARARPTRPPDLNAAVKDLLKAIPIDHLDRRLTALEKWIARLQKDVTRALSRPRRPAPRTTHRRTATPARRRAVHTTR